MRGTCIKIPCKYFDKNESFLIFRYVLIFACAQNLILGFIIKT